MSFEEVVGSLRHPKRENGLPLPRVSLGAVSKDGLFYYAKAFGEERNDTTETNAVHYLASATKIITTVAVMQCVERGQLHLDENVARVLPEWETPQVLTGFDENDQPIFGLSAKPITLRQLLNHSSGLAYVFLDPLLTRYAQLPIAEPRKPTSIKEKFYPFLVPEPGERWIYSPGVDWAGRMVERVTSMRLGDYMKRHIFDVVGVKDATFHLETREDMHARLAKAWERAGDRFRVAAHTPWADPVNKGLGGSGLYSTVNEVLKIYQGILDGRLLRQDTVKTMFQPQLKTTAGLDNQPDHSTSYRNAVYNAIPPDTPVNFGLDGLINMAAIPGRRSSQSLTWSGMPNCYWASVTYHLSPVPQTSY